MYSEKYNKWSWENYQIYIKHKFLFKNYKYEIIELSQKDQNIKQQIQQFNLSYSKYEEELERFSIPIIGKISSGKSTILNYIFDLKGPL